MKFLALFLAASSLYAAEGTFTGFLRSTRYFPDGGRLSFQISVERGFPPPPTAPCTGMVTFTVNQQLIGRYPIRTEEPLTVSYTPASTGWQELRASFIDPTGKCAPSRGFDVAHSGRLGPPYYRVWPTGNRVGLGEIGMIAGIVPPNAPPLVSIPGAEYLSSLRGFIYTTAFEPFPHFPFYSYLLPHNYRTDTRVFGRVDLMYGPVAFPIFNLAEFEVTMLRDGRIHLETIRGESQVTNTQDMMLQTSFDTRPEQTTLDNATLTLYDGNLALFSQPATAGPSILKLPSLAPGRHNLRVEIRGNTSPLRVDSNVLVLDVVPTSQVTLKLSGPPALAAPVETDRLSLEAQVSSNGNPVTSGEVEFTLRTSAGVLRSTARAPIQSGLARLNIGNLPTGSYQAAARLLVEAPLASGTSTLSFTVEPGLSARHAASGAATLAPAALGSLYGRGLATTALSADTPVPDLGGVRLTLEAANGSRTPVPLLFVSPNQINFLVPPDAPLGPAQLEVSLPGLSPLRTPTLLAPSSPGIFTVDGIKIPAALVTILSRENEVFNQFTFRCLVGEACQPEPILIPANAADVVVTLYGTGFRGESATTTGTLAGTPLEVLFAGAQPQFPGLDQINVRLPLSFRGRGTLGLLLRTRSGPAQSIELILR